MKMGKRLSLLYLFFFFVISTIPLNLNENISILSKIHKYIPLGEEVPSAISHPFLNETCYSYTNITAVNTCCKMNQYTADDLQLCASKATENTSGFRNTSRKIKWVFIGDSRVTQIFFSVGILLKDTKVTYSMLNSKKKASAYGPIKEIIPAIITHMDKYIWDIQLVPKEFPLVLEWYWDPHFKRLPGMIEKWLTREDQVPDFLFIEGGLHYQLNIRKSIPESFKLFKKKVEEMVPLLKLLSKQTYAVIQKTDPMLYLTDKWKIRCSEEIISNYNAALSSLAQDSNLVFWDSSFPLAEQYIQQCLIRKKMQIEDDSEEHLWTCSDESHMGYIAIHQYRNMLLNQLCNKYMSLDPQYCP